MLKKICLFCKKEFLVVLSKKNKKYCSQKCYGKSKKGCIPWNKKPPIEKVCLICKKIFKIKPSHAHKRKHCSLKCRSVSQSQNPSPTKGKIFTHLRGKNAAHWKGGITASVYGYIFIYQPNHPLAKGKYVKRATLVMEKHLKRPVFREEIIHHRGIKYPISSVENRQDDRLENLMLFKNRSEHTRFHMLIRQ